MSKKVKKIIIASALAVFVIAGLLVVSFYTGLSLPLAISTNSTSIVEGIISNTNVSDARVLQVVYNQSEKIDDKMAQLIAEECLGKIERYKTLEYLSELKGDKLVINGSPAIFACLEKPDWIAAKIILANLKNVHLTDKNGTSLILASVAAASKDSSDAAKDYFNLLLSIDATLLQNMDSLKAVMSCLAITDTLILNTLDGGDFSLNADTAGLLASDCIEECSRYEVLAFISNKFNGNIIIEGENAVFKCLGSSKPNWEAANILLSDIKDVNIKDKNDVCLLSKSIIAAGNESDESISQFFQTLYQNKTDVTSQDTNGNTPMHYAFKYENKDAMESLFMYIVNNCNLSMEEPCPPNNDSKFPWEYANADVSSAIVSLLDVGWSDLATTVTNWGIKNNKIDEDACLYMADEYDTYCEEALNQNAYDSALAWLQQEINFINYAISIATDEGEKIYLAGKVDELSTKYTSIQAMMKVFDARGNEIQIGSYVYFRIDNYDFYGTVTAIPGNGNITVNVEDADILTKMEIYAQAQINAGMLYNSDRIDEGYELEKEKLFAKYPYGKTVDVIAQYCILY
jgi:hypothetical protein